MGRSHHAIAKRKRERARQEKRRRKEERREERKAQRKAEADGIDPAADVVEEEESSPEPDEG